MEKTELRYKTVTPLLKNTLQQLMSEPLFVPFRLVGGTNLSLRYGHRLSIDIDLFTDFSVADEMPDPKCLLGKDWDIIKIDLIEAAESLL